MQSSSNQHLGNRAGKHFHWLALPSTVHMAGTLVEWWHRARKKHMHLCQHKCHMGRVLEEEEPGWESGLGWEAPGSEARRTSRDTLPCML